MDDLFSVPVGTVPQTDPHHGVDGGRFLPAGGMNPDERECLSILVQNLRNKEALRKLAGEDVLAR